LHGEAASAALNEVHWVNRSHRLDEIAFCCARTQLTAAPQPYRPEMTPLPLVDGVHAAQFWSRFLAIGVVDRSTPMPQVVEPFGDYAELANELLDLVVGGSKRATASALVEYQSEGATLPLVGAMSIATDGAGRARAVLRTDQVRIGPLSSVDDSFAWDEGEGDRSRESWLADHENFFRRYLPTIGAAFDPEMPTVFERFDVLYAE
jgi:uncharacterized protein YhfF